MTEKLLTGTLSFNTIKIYLSADIIKGDLKNNCHCLCNLHLKTCKSRKKSQHITLSEPQQFMIKLFAKYDVYYAML